MDLDHDTREIRMNYKQAACVPTTLDHRAHAVMVFALVHVTEVLAKFATLQRVPLTAAGFAPGARARAACALSLRSRVSAHGHCTPPLKEKRQVQPSNAAQGRVRTLATGIGFAKVWSRSKTATVPFANPATSPATATRTRRASTRSSRARHLAEIRRE